MSPRVIVASPVRQSLPILAEFLGSLVQLRTGDHIRLDFAFVDDNDSPQSSTLLQSFAPPGSTSTVLPAPPARPAYDRSGATHRWTTALVRRVADHKDRLIRFALDPGHDPPFDFVFFVDSDLLLHPDTLAHLLDAGVDIVSEVFWTRWHEAGDVLPSAWQCDHYTLHEPTPEPLSPDEEARQTGRFLARLRTPGIVEVGGLGACTLISRAALRAGCRFELLPNLSWTGEDRHFCLRAAALGFSLYADTHRPPLHLYRQRDLGRVEAWRGSWEEQDRRIAATRALRDALAGFADKHHLDYDPTRVGHHVSAGLRQHLQESESQRAAAVAAGRVVTRVELVDDQLACVVGTEGFEPVRRAARVSAHFERSGAGVLVDDRGLEPLDEPSPRAPFLRRSRGGRVVLAMLVRDEAERYLDRVLRRAAPMVDSVVVLDDGSTDGTPDLVSALLGQLDVEHRLVRVTGSLFDQEWTLRQSLWQLAIASRPDWVLCLDADELLDGELRRDALRPWVDQGQFDVVGFPLFDLWDDEEHYRDDGLWTAHRRSWPLLVRRDPNDSDAWARQPQHCGRFPLDVAVRRRVLPADLRVLHLGWLSPEDRRRKAERYALLDPDGRWGSAEQYASILDSSPRLARLHLPAQ